MPGFDLFERLKRHFECYTKRISKVIFWIIKIKTKDLSLGFQVIIRVVKTKCYLTNWLKQKLIALFWLELHQKSKKQTQVKKFQAWMK